MNPNLPLIITAAAAVLLSSLPQSFGQSSAPTVVAIPINRLPFVIRKPGTYILRKDLSYGINSSNAISIEASDVILDLGGKVLSCSAPQDINNNINGINSSSVDTITIRNGTVRGFSSNINLFTGGFTGRFVIENVISENAGSIGLRVFGPSARVANCTVLNTGYKSSLLTPHGILAEGGDVEVEGNTVRDLQKTTTSHGIRITASRSGLAKNNIVSTGTIGTTGILLSATLAVTGAFADENYIANFETGLSLPNGGKYRGNLTRGCTTAFSGGTAVGTENN
jgi:hypothetical protein